VTAIVCTSDLHKHLVDIPECDLLLIAGDVSHGFGDDLAAMHAFLAGDFKDWLDAVPAREAVLVAGNHDKSIQAWGVPDGLRCHYLQDAEIELLGLRIWGTPWQPWFGDWAYNAPRSDGEVFLATKFDRIPAGIDIVVAHGPPRGCGDRTHRGAHVGSTALAAALERVEPRLTLTGHIHEAYGRYRLGSLEVINASHVDQSYRPANPVIELAL